MLNSFPSTVAVPFGARPRRTRLLLMLLFLGTACLWFSSRAMSNSNFLPHWYCLAGNARLLWTTVLADLLIGVSYVAISATLVRIVRRSAQELPYQGFFWAFGIFIVSCGATHFMEIVTIWKPVYWAAAAVKILTAVSSVGTALVLLLAAEDIIGFIRTSRHVITQRGHERFRALFMATPLAVLSFDLEGLVTSWNPSAEEIFGFRERDILGKSNPIVPPELEPEHSRMLRSSLSGAVTKSYETVRQRSDGTRIPVSACAAPLYDEAGKQIGVMTTIEDISARKQMEKELREKTDTLLEVTHALNTFLETGDWILASRELLSFAVKQTESEFGFLGVVLDGSRLRILAHEGFHWDRSTNYEFFEQALERYQREGYLEFFNLKNLFGEVIRTGQTVISNQPEADPRSGGLPPGHPRLHAFLGVPIYKGNEIVGLIGVANRAGGYSGEEWRSLETMSRATGVLFDDYRQNLTRSATEQKNAALEAHLRQSQNLELLARLSGGIAHDFNNMLMIISGSAELLERSLGPDSQCQAYIQQMQSTATKAAGITRQLLAFSRKQVLDLRDVNLHATLDDSRSMLARLLGPDIQLVVQKEATQCWMRSDPPQLVQVLATLVGNARDAMPSGGRMELRTRNADAPPGSANTSPSSKCGWLVLEASDTGAGMDKQTLARIFEPFFTTKPPGTASGLGLASAYGVIRQSGGHVQVQSEPGRGTRFEIFFPAIAEPHQHIGDHSPQSREPHLSGATVLLVDDESALVHAIGEFLRNSGYVVLDALSPQEALQIAKEHPGRIDILVTDVIMPGLRGPELHRQVLSLHSEIQVLFMSGYAEGLPEMQLPSGARFLQKPFRFSALLESLRQMRPAA